MVKKLLLLLLNILGLLSLVSVVSASVVINEIMYDPSTEQGGDSNGEWIEVYNSGSEVNLSGWILKDSGSANTSLGGVLSNNSYLIVADNATNFNATYNCTCQVIDGSLGLSNSGDEVWLWNETALVDYVSYNDTAAEGNSLQLVNGSWCEGESSPGEQGSCLPEEEEDVELEVLDDVLNIIAKTDQNKLFKVDFHSTKENCSKTTYPENADNITVSYNITNSTGLVKEANFTVEVGCYVTAGTGEWTPLVDGNYTLCGNITSTTSGNANSSNDFVCANISVMPNPLTLIETPVATRFGDLELILFNLELSEAQAAQLEINSSNLRFLAYTPSGAGHYVIKDLDNEIIYSVKGCNSNMALQINNISANSTFYVGLPFFVGLRCDSSWDGNYPVKVRVFNLNLSGGECPGSCTGNKCLDLADFEITINGYNSIFCSGSGGGGSATTTESEGKGKLIYSILSVPAEITALEDFTVKVQINNEQNISQKLSIWSYVYRGPKCYSCYENRTRESNKRVVELASKTSTVVELRDSVNASAGEYKLKIKILKEGLKTPKEFRFNVTVLEAEAEATEATEAKTESLLKTSSVENKSLLSASTEPVTIYKSKTVTIRETAFYWLTAISLAMCIYLILKR